MIELKTKLNGYMCKIDPDAVSYVENHKITGIIVNFIGNGCIVVEGDYEEIVSQIEEAKNK